MRKQLFILLFVGLSGQLFGQGAGQPRPQGGATGPAVTPTTPAATPNTTPQTAIAGAPANDNPSIRPTPEGDIMFKRTLWRVINLKEKQNKPMFALNHEISRLIIDAVKSG
jgi:hypothetical protein